MRCMKVKYGDTEDAARKKMAELRVNEDQHNNQAAKTHDTEDLAGGKRNEAKKRAEVEKEVAADR